MKLRIYIIPAVLLFVFTLGQLFAQDIDSKLKANTIDKVSKLLEDHYVFHDIGKKCGEHIKAKLSSGAFDNISSTEEFAEVLTKELQSISKDKHMRVRPGDRPPSGNEPDNPFLQEFHFNQQNRIDNFGFYKVEHLEGNIGYLDIRFFAGLRAAEQWAAAAMQLLSGSDALIIDLRENHGGSPEIIRFICSYFFDKPTHLNSLYWREGDRTEEFWTTKTEISSLTDVPIFVLTSSTTFSGGEEFANNLKTRKRATIIGETTGGGANPGNTFRINDTFIIFIPTGRAINPVTNSNWEGVGVEPDIKTSSDEAYSIALKKALEAAEEYRNRKMETASAVSRNIMEELNEAEKLISSNPEKAEEILNNALEEGISSGLIDENSINSAGYDYLFKDKIDMAIALFNYNVNKFPKSFNVYDSLGEAYMKNNQKELAISNYRKSLELNPDNKNAEEMIKKMGE